MDNPCAPGDGAANLGCSRVRNQCIFNLQNFRLSMNLSGHKPNVSREATSCPCDHLGSHGALLLPHSVLFNSVTKLGLYSGRGNSTPCWSEACPRICQQDLSTWKLQESHNPAGAQFWRQQIKSTPHLADSHCLQISKAPSMEQSTLFTSMLSTRNLLSLEQEQGRKMSLA